MNRLATALSVFAVVAGPPLLAAAWLQAHPWRTPTTAQIQTWAEQPLTPGTVVAGCVTAAALVWLLLLTYLARRAVTDLRRRLRRTRHLAMPTPAQLTAGSMAGVAAFAMPAMPSSPQPPPTAADTPPPADPAGTPTDQHAVTETAGVALPGGGWIPYRTATAITALAALSWLHRRRRYRPDPHHPRDHRTDPDLQPLPDTVHTVTTALTTDTAAEPATTPLLTPGRLPHGILRLSGPGATAAGRGLLVTAALTAAATVPPVRIHLDDLTTLLPGTDTADLPAAVLATTISSGSGTPSGAEPGEDEDADHQPHPADPATRCDPDERPRTVIVLSDNPRADNIWHIGIDGAASGTGLNEPRRLCTLDLSATTDLLALVRAMQTPAPGTDLPRHVDETVASGPEPAASATAAHLTLLGGCELMISGAPVHLRRTAALQILTYLAVHPGGATRAQLTRALWPHLPAATIAGRFHTTLTDLRRQLHPLLGDEPVTRHEDHYRLNTRAISTDLQPWTATVDAVVHALGTTAQQHACRRLLDQYRGDLAADRTWPWLIPAREQIRRTVLDTCTTLAEHADPTEALTWLRHATTIDPYNEPLHQQAADLLNTTGDPVGAADLIKRLHRRLADREHTPPEPA